ncbi:TPA: hypothetical protein ACIK0N_001683 [Campylobacter jejuni]|nr:hypothetical protein [Campylobacter sp. US24a]EAI0804381.1 hypothetical protein [Campylobacter jejuni]TEX84626.1 hypothetical protein ELQ04_03085 [Campylobacter sp. CH278]ECP8784877.1 hypothetical protein [Campylobacter jejuni]EDP7299065.1 hypothetical protein [Campylobacter jejuni]EKY4296096.1 hypothetical protein [Campylobacter jejuni]
MPTEQTDLEYLFSKERLESYNNIYEHFDNLKMIASITTKIAILELVLRNLLDKHMKEKDLEWLRNYNEENIKQKIIKLQNKEILDNNQLISRISLGDVIFIIKLEHLEAKIINSSNINFKKYYAHNKEYYFHYVNNKKYYAHNKEYYFHYVNNKKYKNSFSNIEKANTVLNLLLTIRNRSFHWENLYKTKITNQKALAPRITTKSHNTFIGVMPNKINTFLSDLIESFEKDLNSYLK